MKKIGLVSIDTSHPYTFARVMKENPELGLMYSMVYDDGFRSNDEVNWFIEKYGMQGRARTIDELAEKTDVGFIQGCNWDKKLEQAMPFIKLGKPVFIDKPFVGRVSDMEKVRKLIKNGAFILGSSASRYAREVSEFLEKPVSERGEVIAVNILSGVDEFNYAVNGCEVLSEIVDSDAVSCRYLAGSVRDGGECETFLVRFKNGVIGTYCTCLSGWHPFRITILTSKTSCIFTIDSAAVYKEILTRISNSLHGSVPATANIERIMNVTQFMLCGKKSRDYENGREVFVSELDENDAFDGDSFEKEYANKAKVLYTGI